MMSSVRFDLHGETLALCGEDIASQGYDYLFIDLTVV
jgi:hypothetical protein